MESDDGGGQDQLRERVSYTSTKQLSGRNKTKDVLEHSVHESI